VQAWKREVIRKHPRGLPKEYEEGFEVLEAEEGAGWDLACQVRVQGLKGSTVLGV
jgi:hypothetical protein